MDDDMDQALSQLRALSKDERLQGAMSQALLAQLGTLLGAEQQNVGVANGAGTAQQNDDQTLTAQQMHRGALSGYHGE